MLTLRPLTADEVQFIVSHEPEELDYHDHFDAQAAAYVDKNLVAGNTWAWCSIEVMAMWNGEKAYAYLGSCSYKSYQDFCNDTETFEQLKMDAVENLNKKNSDKLDKLKSLIIDTSAAEIGKLITKLGL